MYTTKTWVDRQSQHPNRRRLTAAGAAGVYDVSPEEGEILEEGNTFDADTMNDLERRIADAVAAVEAAMEANLPPIGDWVLAGRRITYASGDVNSKTHPWVNFDDNLLPARYPKLYELYGDAWSSADCPAGYFNLGLLQDRFPLVSASNFGGIGGEEKHTLTISEMPRHAHSIALNEKGNNDYLGVIDAVKMSGRVYSSTFTRGGDQPHNNMPPYVRTTAHVRAG